MGRRPQFAVAPPSTRQRLADGFFVCWQKAAEDCLPPLPSIFNAGPLHEVHQNPLARRPSPRPSAILLPTRVLHKTVYVQPSFLVDGKGKKRENTAGPIKNVNVDSLGRTQMALLRFGRVLLWAGLLVLTQLSRISCARTTGRMPSHRKVGRAIWSTVIGKSGTTKEI